MYGSRCWSRSVLTWERQLWWGQMATTMRACSTREGMGIEWLSRFKNYEKIGIPKNAGVDGDEGFRLKNMSLLMSKLGSPEKAYKSVHVAGTKGKGSTVAFLESILHESSYVVGSYTSPHIRTLSERIRTSKRNIPEEDFDALVEDAAPILESCQRESPESPLSYFEVLTGLAFKYFKDSRIDIALVETGLGGIRDATNVLAPEDVSAAVITPIGMDHAEALGGSLESIARSKAGIIKYGKPVILSKQVDPSVEAIVLHCASEKKSPSVKVASSVSYEIPQYVHISTKEGVDARCKQPTIFHIEGDFAKVVFGLDTAESVEMDVDLPIVGQHQADNAATAITTAMTLRSHCKMERITLDSIKKGLEKANIQGRFQVVDVIHDHGTGQPMYTVVDGAHTKDSAMSLVSTIQSAFGNAPVALVLAMASDKSHKEFCEEIQAINPSIVVFTDVPIAGDKHRSMPPGALAGAWQAAQATGKGERRHRCRHVIQASMKAAITKARHEILGQIVSNNSPGVVVVTGSLHAVGSALSEYET